MLASINRTFHFINQHPLAKKHLLRAYFNFIKWQVISRFTNQTLTLKFVGDTKFIAKRKLTGITGNIYTGLHEFDEMSFVLHFLRKEDLFFDVGANVGAYTLLASGVKGARSISFEPEPTTFKILQKNISVNGLEKLVFCKNTGVGQEVKTVSFTSNQDTANHVIINEQKINTIEIEIVPLNAFYPESKPILIKIDVEGFETEVLKGASEILKDTELKALIIELNGSGNKYGFNDEYLHQELLNLNFLPYKYDPFIRQLSRLESYGNFNTIYIRDIDFCVERLCSSAAFEVFNEIL